MSCTRNEERERDSALLEKENCIEIHKDNNYFS
jgi:hypothetical protein